MSRTGRAGKRMQSTLGGIANRAHCDKDHRFGALYGLLNENWLRECLPFLNKRAASGVDRVTAQQYAENLDQNLEQLVDRLKRKVYRAKLVRRKEIPKDGGKVRALGIPALEDKLLQVAVSKILQAIYEEDFLDCSYGYRPITGAPEAIRDLTRELQFGRHGWIVEADIKGYFDNIDHDWLIKMLEKRIDDRPFLALIRKWLKAGILTEEGMVIDPNTGTPQGGIVSPVLANIYLHHVLDEWFEIAVKPRNKGQAYYTRYADDFVAAFQYKDEARVFYESLGPRLEKFGLELSPAKTRMIKFSRFQLKDGEALTYLGFEIRWMKDRKGDPRVMRRTAPKRKRRSLGEFSTWVKSERNTKVRELFPKINAKLYGHYAYFGVIGNSYSLWGYYAQALRILFKWLNRRSQRRSYTWKGFCRLCRRLGLACPRITEYRNRQLSFDFVY